jgi:hypothetical protein
MVKKPQRKQLPCKKFTTDTELCRKNVRVESTFNFSVVLAVNAENVVLDA